MNTYIEAKQRTPNQREKILKLLRAAGSEGLTNVALKDVCVRWSSRIQELYQEGYTIDVIPVKNGIYKYIFISEPEVKRSKPKQAVSLVVSEIDGRYDGTITSEDLQTLLDSMGMKIVRKIGTHKVAAN
jgi:hypothetical protein